MTYKWEDKVFLITGGSNGIGSLVVRMALEEGVKRVFILDIDETKGVALQDELNEKYGADKVKFVKCDLCDDEQLKSSFTSVIGDKSNSYIVMNGAGILNDNMRTYKRAINVNVTALITGSLIALDLMRKDKGGQGGAIINISSVAAFCNLPHTPIYNATKAAVLLFSNALGMDEYYLRTQVRVLTMCFGATNTSLLSMENMGSFDEDIEKKILEALATVPEQKVESAARAVIDMYKLGSSGSTWLSNADKPVQDISDVVARSNAILTEQVVNP